MGARGGAWARACTCAYMRNARTFAASASSWSTRARRIAFSSSTATEHKEGSEDEEEGGEEGEEEGDEEDEEERGEEEDELLLGFFPPVPAPAPAPAPGLTARLLSMWAAAFDGGFLAAGRTGVVSQARAHEQQQHAHTHPAFQVSHGSPFFFLQPEQLPHLGLRMWLGTMNETQANEPLRRALPWEPETGAECDVHEKPSEDGCVHVDAVAAVELGGEHGVSHCVSHCGLNARWCRGYRQLPRAGWRA